jgi:hypothetical protein
MKFFIASPWKNKASVSDLTTKLIAKGHMVYSFLESGANLATGMSIADELGAFSNALSNWQNDPNIKNIFESEMEGIRSSDAVILLQPAGHSSLLEAGIGYGMGKEVIIIGPIEKPEVVYLISKRFYPSVDSFVDNI